MHTEMERTTLPGVGWEELRKADNPTGQVKRT